MRGSYHGRSFGAVSVTGVAAWKMSSHDPFGTHYLHGTDRQLPQYRNLSDADYIKACVDDLRALLTAGGPPGRRRLPAGRAGAGRGRVHHGRPTGCSPRTRKSSTSTASC